MMQEIAATTQPLAGTPIVDQLAFANSHKTFLYLLIQE
jgi:hypothetical protein